MGPVSKFAQATACIAAFGGLADAFWRLPCRGVEAYARIDPLVDTGHIAAHVHAIHGGNNLGFSTTPEDLLNSTCTSCGVEQDKSAYWTPSLYFMGDNGEFEQVTQAGGMLAYYLLYPNPGEQIVAFPEGFAMLAGNPYRRNYSCQLPEPPISDWTGYEVSQPGLAQKALGFNCLNYQEAPEPSLYRHFLPEKSFMDRQCTDGLRLELMFPSCWNGEQLNPPDHQSHMAYPNAVMSGTCPEGFPKRVPSLFFETIWNTQDFVGRPGRFVLSNGDPTGYGYHGDFFAGWEPGVLQQAVDICTNESGEVSDCPVFDLQSQDSMQQCKIDLPQAIKKDNPYGPMPALLGDNPLTWGPSPAPDHAGPVAADTGDDLRTGVEDLAHDVHAAPDNAHAAAPATTPAPKAAPAYNAGGDNDAMLTKLVTKGNEVWEILVEQEVKTVTADQAPVRRHMHHRQHHAAGLQ